MPTAIIWGAGGGIGLALTQQLIDADWDVVAFTRYPDKTEPIATATIEVDNVANAAAVETAIFRAQYEIDSAELFVYAVGDIAQVSAEMMDPNDWKRIIDANLTGAYITYRASLPLLTNQSHLVFIGAVSERLELPKLSAYVAAKAGLEAFVATLRKERRKQPITLVRPGAVDTAFWNKVALRKPKDAATAAQVAGRIIDAYDNKRVGVLDITH